MGQEIQLGGGEAASGQQVPLCSCCPGPGAPTPHGSGFQGSPGSGVPSCSAVLRAGMGLVLFATISQHRARSLASTGHSRHPCWPKERFEDELLVSPIALIVETLMSIACNIIICKRIFSNTWC